VAALTGGTLPDHPSGSGYARLPAGEFQHTGCSGEPGRHRLVAPFAGQVASVATSVGDYVSPGQVILVISDVTHMHIETTDLSERDVPQVKLGQSVNVLIKALNQNVSGKVSAISPVGRFARRRCGLTKSRSSWIHFLPACAPA